MRKFINAGSINEIVFTRGTTESINLLASSFGEAFLHPGDEVIVSVMEHHSNIVPWQLLAERKCINLKVIPMNDRGELLMDEYEKLFTDRTKIVSVVHVSNVLGTVNPIKEMIKIAHNHDVPFLVDAAQSIPHMAVDVKDLDADFLVFSGHKVYGPTGVGGLRKIFLGDHENHTVRDISEKAWRCFMIVLQVFTTSDSLISPILIPRIRKYFLTCVASITGILSLIDPPKTPKYFTIT